MLTPENLRPDQIQAIDWLVEHPEAFVLLPIGFGKTIVTLTALERINASHLEREAARLADEGGVGSDEPRRLRTLVVSTKNIVEHTWGTEIGRWSHLAGLTYASAAGRKIKAVESRPDFLGINFESLEWLLDQCDVDPSLLPECLVIDESSKMKSPSANRVRRLAGFRMKRKPGAPRRKPGEPLGYIHRFQYRYALSATPNAEGHEGLFAQEACISLKRRLGKNISEFRDRYCKARNVGPTYVYDVTKEGAKKIEATIADITYAPDEAEYMDLPEPIQEEVIVPWTKKAREEYEHLEAKFFHRFDVDPALQGEAATDVDFDQVGADSIAVLLNKLRQASSGFLYDDEGNERKLSDPRPKLRALEAVCERSAESPIVVFTQYIAEAEAIGEHFREAVVGLPETLDDWNAGRIPMLVLHPRSAGHGLNLQDGGHICVFYSLPWSFEEWIQAWGRLHRGGQTKRVSVLRLMRPDSIDGDVWGKIQTKERRLDSFITNMRTRGNS